MGSLSSLATDMKQESGSAAINQDDHTNIDVVKVVNHLLLLFHCFFSHSRTTSTADLTISKVAAFSATSASSFIREALLSVRKLRMSFSVQRAGSSSASTKVSLKYTFFAGLSLIPSRQPHEGCSYPHPSVAFKV